jgi:hypothetical protein
MERKVLKVKLSGGPTGHIYPDFSSMDAVKDAGYNPIAGEPANGPFARYTNLYCQCLYDKKRSVYDDSAYSPHGTYWMMIIAPADFVTEAVSKFPATCAELTEAEATTFYEGRVTHKQPSQLIDTNILLGIKAKSDLSIVLTQEDIDAKDPAKDTPGVRANPNKTFSGLLTEKNITIKV